LVVIPSRLGPSGETEGQGIVVLEAFAARACVIATAIGGITSMVRDHATGALVEPGNSKALATALEQLLNEADLRQQLAANAFAEVCERYSWTRVAGDFAEVYRVILRAGVSAQV
jgi:D-inositol-3-phosphate glycosyltransferase